MNHRPTEPPIPQPEHYELSNAASRQTRLKRLLHWVDTHPGWVASGAVAVIAAVPVYIVAQDNPATGAADRAAVVSNPTAVPGVPVKAGPEYAPPVPDTVTGDGMWIVGKQIKAGVYQSAAGVSCYWERLAGLSGTYEDLLDNGGYRKGQQLVEVLASDFAFTSQGCGQWVMVR